MQKTIKMLPDVLIASGGIAVAVGAGLLHIAAGFIVGGLLAIAFGVMAAKATPKAAQ